MYRHGKLPSGGTRLVTVCCVSFVHDGLQTDGPDFISFSGEIRMEEDVKIPGFRAGGLSIKVCRWVLRSFFDLS